MTAIEWIWKIALAFVGAVAGAYISQELIGGGAFGAIALGAILIACCYPLIQALLTYRKQKADRAKR